MINRVLGGKKLVRTEASTTEDKPFEIVKKNAAKELNLPSQDRFNPFARSEISPYKYDKAKATYSINAHSMAVSS